MCLYQYSTHATLNLLLLLCSGVCCEAPVKFSLTQDKASLVLLCVGLCCVVSVFLTKIRLCCYSVMCCDVSVIISPTTLRYRLASVSIFCVCCEVSVKISLTELKATFRCVAVPRRVLQCY